MLGGNFAYLTDVKNLQGVATMRMRTSPPSTMELTHISGKLVAAGPGNFGDLNSTRHFTTASSSFAAVGIGPGDFDLEANVPFCEPDG